ncbi:MAG TPA: PTS sugar transporter subunit IIA [Ilumatobacteraceae bacterium]|jgi:PTS system mannitol-specific IIA component
MGDGRTVELLTPTGVLLGQEATDFNDAIRQVGAVLVAVGAVDPSYVDAMLEREQSISTFVGEGVAIPHGTLAGKDSVLRDALAVVQFPGGVDWHGDRVEVCIGIAAVGDGHVGILAQLAEVLMDEDRAAALRGATSVDDVIVILTPDDE